MDETDQLGRELATDYDGGELTDAEFDDALDVVLEEEGLEGRSMLEKNSISETEAGEPFVEVEEDILQGVPEKQWASTVKENLKKKFPNGITVGNSTIRINQQSLREMTFSGYMKWLRNNDPQLRADKLRATNNADEILQATTDWVNEGLNHSRKDSIADFARGNVLLRVGGNDYTADVVVGTKKNGSMMLYDILNLHPTAFTKKETATVEAKNPSPGTGRSTVAVSGDSVAENGLPVKKQYSVSEESGPLEMKLRDGKSLQDGVVDKLWTTSPNLDQTKIRPAAGGLDPRRRL